MAAHTRHREDLVVELAIAIRAAETEAERARAKASELRQQLRAILDGESAPSVGLGELANSSTPSANGSVRARMLEHLRSRPGAKVDVNEISSALGIENTQAIRDAGRRLVLDPESGVHRVTAGVFVFRADRPARLGRSRRRDGTPGAPGRKPSEQTVRFRAAIRAALEAGAATGPAIVQHALSLLGDDADSSDVTTQLRRMVASSQLVQQDVAGERRYSLASGAVRTEEPAMNE